MIADVERVSDDEHHVTVKIRDTGIGIPADRQHNLFSPFVTVDPSFARKYGGTGLGLAICSKIVDMLGGATSF